MQTITILKEAKKERDLVAIPRKEYEALVHTYTLISIKRHAD